MDEEAKVGDNVEKLIQAYKIQFQFGKAMAKSMNDFDILVENLSESDISELSIMFSALADQFSHKKPDIKILERQIKHLSSSSSRGQFETFFRNMSMITPYMPLKLHRP